MNLFTVMPLTRDQRPVSYAKRNVRPSVRKPLAGHWFPKGNARLAKWLDRAILPSHLDNSRHPSRASRVPSRMNLLTKAKNLGILTEFVDGQGVTHLTSETALKIIVNAFPPRTPSRFIEGTVVIRSGQPARNELAEAANLPVTWKIDAGPGVVR